MDRGPANERVQRERVAQLLQASYRTDLGEVAAFLPARVPVSDLPTVFGPYLSACAELPARYPAVRKGVRKWLDRVFARDLPSVRYAIPLLSDGERDAAMTVLSVLGHAYRWDSMPPAPARFRERYVTLPAGIAYPWGALARIYGHPRVGTTWSLHLCNWKMHDTPSGAAYRPENLTSTNVGVAWNWLLPPFDVHLDRFSISFVLLEACGAAVLRHLVGAIDATICHRGDDAVRQFHDLAGAISTLTRSFSTHVRKATVDPTVWLELVQPTFPWSAEAEEPGQIEGGPSGMQLGTMQALDAGLGIGGGSTLAQLARAGRRYMPKPHRRFLRILDRAGPIVRAQVRQSGDTKLTEQFDRCVRALSSFRATHQARGTQYLRHRPPGDGARASTGLTIGVNDDALLTFDRTMAERVRETRAATLG